MQDDLFGAADLDLPVERERVLMSLNPQYYELIWQRLKRHEFRQDLPYPKKQRRLPRVLSLGEVAQLIDAAGNLQQRLQSAVYRMAQSFKSQPGNGAVLAGEWNCVGNGYR